VCSSDLPVRPIVIGREDDLDGQALGHLRKGKALIDDLTTAGHVEDGIFFGHNL
jgi:hypothetical protein